MPPRKSIQRDVEDMPLSLSQQSGSSDDLALRASIEEKMKASWEKKRNEKERKFLHTIKTELEQSMSLAWDEVESKVQSMDDAYAKFVLDYAASEDVIRELWLRIRNEYDTLHKLAIEHIRNNSECIKNTENGQIQGMALAKEACEDSKTIIYSLTSSSNFK